MAQNNGSIKYTCIQQRLSNFVTWTDIIEILTKHVIIFMKNRTFAT